MKARARVYIIGYVQGVFFRHETRRLASRLGVTGWVKNLSDGRVEALFEGEKDLVEKVIEFCRQGPPNAEVQNIEIHWEPWRDEFNDFKIAY